LCTCVLQDLALPKLLGGHAASGRQLAELLKKLVMALNSQEIPNVASMLEVFNKDLVSVGVFNKDLVSVGVQEVGWRPWPLTLCMEWCTTGSQ
jgi:hypothetical protein